MKSTKCSHLTIFFFILRKAQANIHEGGHWGPPNHSTESYAPDPNVGRLFRRTRDSCVLHGFGLLFNILFSVFISSQVSFFSPLSFSMHAFISEFEFLFQFHWACLFLSNFFTPRQSKPPCDIWSKQMASIGFHAGLGCKYKQLRHLFFWKMNAEFSFQKFIGSNKSDTILWALWLLLGDEATVFFSLSAVNGFHYEAGAFFR